MNILEQTEALKDLPDQALVKEMQMPTGMAPPVFITAELKRRQRMRDDFKRREAQDMPTVAEEVVMAAGMPQGGIADAARAMAPKSSIAQNTGMNEMMPAAATRAPQRMAEGGIVRMAKGGRTPVEYNGLGYFILANGQVQDAIGRPVSDELAEAIKASLEKSPEVQDESAAPTGSEVLRDAAPQVPTLDSAISSDRPFSPLSTEVTDIRPATPSDLGMGGERPATLTTATQPAFNQEQALLDAMSPAFDTFGGEALARAEQRSNLSGPSISEVSPTVDLDLTTDQRISQEDMAMAVPVPQGQPRNFTQLLSDIENPVERGKAILAQSQGDQAQPYEGGQYTNADAIRNYNERTRGKVKTPQDMAEERLLFSNMNLPPDSAFAEFAGVDNPETQHKGYRGGKDYMDESEDFYDDISENLLAPKTPDQIAREDLEKQKGLDAFLKSQEMRGGRPGGSLPVDVLSQPVTDDTYRMPDVTDPSDIFYGDDISPFDPSDIKRPREEFLAEVARQDPLDLPTRSTSLTPLQSIGGQDNVEVAASANPLPVTDSGANPFADAYESFQDSINQTKAMRDAEKEPPLKQILMEQGIAEVARQDPFDVPQSDDPSFPDGFTLGTAGDAASNALSFGDVNKLISDDAGGGGGDGGGGGGGGIVPTGGAATGLEARITQMLSDREADKDSDKWMALAQAGLALMASKNPTLGGAIGEAGLAGVGALKKAKSQYDADILGLMGLEEKARSSRLSREAALAKASRPKEMTGTERVGLLREAGDLRETLTKLEADIQRGGVADQFGNVLTPFTPEQLAEKESQARLLKSEINKYKGMAYPQLANVQTVNPS